MRVGRNVEGWRGSWTTGTGVGVGGWTSTLGTGKSGEGLSNRGETGRTRQAEFPSLAERVSPEASPRPSPGPRGQGRAARAAKRTYPASGERGGAASFPAGVSGWAGAGGRGRTEGRRRRRGGKAADAGRCARCARAGS